MSDPIRIDVAAAAGGYPVLVGAGASSSLPQLARAHAPGGRVGLVSDSNVGPLHAERIAEACRQEGLAVSLQTFPAGERSKTRTRWAELTDAFLDFGLGRDGCVMAVGGGVATDLGGFVAATYLRGVPVIQVPTSYLAMIDASVGGKTGVDVEAGKNLVGAFHAPVAVVADTALLRTLPAKERGEGLVEAVKHGAILDGDHLEVIEEGASDLLAAEADTAASVIAASVRIKAEVVAEDEREGGYRQILNFGHTVGHAVEAASEYGLGHGSAVALGMVAEAQMGEEMGITVAGTRDRLERVLGRILGRDAVSDAAPETADALFTRAVGFLDQDKKVRGGRPRYVLLEGIGSVAPGEGWTHDVPDEIAHGALERVLKGG